MTDFNRLERLPCGSYVTPDERFYVASQIGERGPTRRWTIADFTKSDVPTHSVRTLADAEDWIASNR